MHVRSARKSWSLIGALALVVVAVSYPWLRNGEAEAALPAPRASDGGEVERFSQTDYRARWDAVHARYAMRDDPSVDGVRVLADNPAHGYRATFHADGFAVAPGEAAQGRWTWGLELAGVARDQHLHGVPAAITRHHGRRLVNDRGWIREWYVNHIHGLQQGFTLDQRPAGDGDLALVLRSVGDLTPRLHGVEVRLADAGGVERLAYRRLVAWDAAGRDLPARMELHGRHVHLRVDDRGAEYPIVIDPFTCSTDGIKDENDDVVELTNQERWDNGQLAPMSRDDDLEHAAEWHSEDMSQWNVEPQHDSIVGDCGILHWCAGESWSARFNDARDGYPKYPGGSKAENIAAGYSSPSAVMTGWMNSSGHRANILGSRREIGVGYHRRSGTKYTHYWTQDFGSSSSWYPLVIEREAFSTDVQTVDLYVYDAGRSHVRFSNDQSCWSPAEAYAANKTGWSLAQGKGNKTVYVRHYNSLADAENNVNYLEYYDCIWMTIDGVAVDPCSGGDGGGGGGGGGGSDTRLIEVTTSQPNIFWTIAPVDGTKAESGSTATFDGLTPSATYTVTATATDPG